MHQPGCGDRCHGEVRRDHGLDCEQRQPAQGHELRHKANEVDAKAGDEAPLMQHPDHESRVDAAQPAPGRDAGRPEARRADRHRLHDRGDSVAQRRHHGSYETRQHEYDPTPR